MTTPAPNLPAPPAVRTSDFQGVLVPADVQARIISLLIEQAAFGRSITRLTTSAGEVAFPVASPTGAAWVAELQRIPLMSLNDRAEVVAVAKLAGLLDVSNETMHDSAVNLTAQFTTLLQDSLSKQLDEGLLFGSGPPEPTGIVAAAPEVAGADLLTAVLTARGEIADAGGTADRFAASGAALAAADGTRDTGGQLVFPGGGFAAATGLEPVTVPGLATPLVWDSTRVYLIVRDDARVEVTDQWRWEFDATTFRVKARMACAVPDPQKAIRKLAVGGTGGGEGGGTRTATAPAGRSGSRA